MTHLTPTHREAIERAVEALEALARNKSDPLSSYGQKISDKGFEAADELTALLATPSDFSSNPHHHGMVQTGAVSGVPGMATWEQPATPTDAQSGVALIAAERARQIAQEGWTAEHDDDHCDSEMAVAAACYALPKQRRREKIAYIEMDAARGCSDPAIPYRVKKRIPCGWPWDAEWWRPVPKDRIRELVKAGALIAAEIDRLKRAAIAAEMKERT